MNSKATTLRVIVIGLALAFVLHYIWKSQLDPSHTSLLLTMVSVALTAVYVVLTFEIVLQNQKMTHAAFESAGVMERSLRLSYSPSIALVTCVTKYPELAELEFHCSPIKNDDYDRAIKEHPAGDRSMEFVFAIIRNVGTGKATKLQMSVRYEVQEQANPNLKYSVAKEASIPLLESGQALALIIHICRTPSAGDGVKLQSASIQWGDFYRDALLEAAQVQEFTAANSSTSKDRECTLIIRQ